MKKLSLVLAGILLFALLSFPVHADTRRVVDEADLFSTEEETSLEAKIQEIAEEYQFDVVIVTENQLGGKSPMAFADDFFDYNGYGYGPDRDGILFLISMEDRDWWISTRGYGLTAFTDYGLNHIGDAVVPYLSDGEYADAMEHFLTLTDEFLDEASQGTPYDVTNQKRNPLMTAGIILLFVAVVSLVIMLILKSQLKSKRAQYAANPYVREGSFQLKRSQDIFLYSHVSKTKRTSNSGGGSSSHTSSSGASHGGTGGKF